MCDDCDRMALEQTLVYVAKGYPLEAAIRLERDAVVQRALKDKVGLEALEDALTLSATVERVGEHLAYRQQTDPRLFWGAVSEVADTL